MPLLETDITIDNHDLNTLKIKGKGYNSLPAIVKDYPASADLDEVWIKVQVSTAELLQGRDTAMQDRETQRISEMNTQIDSLTEQLRIANLPAEEAAKAAKQAEIDRQIADLQAQKDALSAPVDGTPDAGEKE